MSFRFWRGAKQEDDLEQEIQTHLQMAAKERIESGETPAQAEAAARREFGNLGMVKDVTREVWGLGWVERLRLDLRYGLRILWKSPVYGSVSVLTLALGIGASTAIFSVVYGVLLQSLPYYKPEQIVRVSEVNSRGRPMAFADANFIDVQDQAHSLESMAEWGFEVGTVSVGNTADSVTIASVSKDFFSVLGVAPVRGRLFAADEQHAGAASTAVVSYSFWQQHLHGVTDLDFVKFTISKVPTTIIGVLPPAFHFPGDTQVWTARETQVRDPSRTGHNWRVVARLRDGVSIDQARLEVSAIAHSLSRQYSSDPNMMVDASIVPLREALTVNVRPALLVLLAVAGLLLLVAVANVANLSLAQASARAGELAVRTALGASRWRLIRQFLAEALLLCLLGGCLGVLAARAGVRILLAQAPANIPRLEEVSVNMPVLLFALGLSVLLAAGLGTFTALRATSGNVQTALAEGGRSQGTGVRSQRAGSIIVAAQVATTLTLLVGAGLLGHSMLRVLSVYPGFQTEHLLSLELQLPAMLPTEKAQRAQFLEQVISRLQAIPGVRNVGATNALPLQAGFWPDGAFAIIQEQQLTSEQKEMIDRAAHFTGEPDPELMKFFDSFMGTLFRNQEKTGNADYVVASEGYFQSLGIPLLRGRLFTDADTFDAPQVAVISESVARQKWPGQDPIGQTIEFGNMDADPRLLTIVGVVGDIREDKLESEPASTIYVNYRQRPQRTSPVTIVLRTNSEPDAIFTPARRILSDLDPTVPLKFSTFPQILSGALNGRRFNLVLVGVFAGSALLLAMAGIFGVLVYSVTRRTREIGVRIALGASSVNVLKLILKQALVTAVAGIVIGLVGSLLLTRTMRSLLFEVSPADPLTLVCVTLLLLIVALLASYVPAQRATRVDPIVALRYE